MSEAVFRDHIEQIWNNKNARAIERFIAPNYRGFEGAEAISGIEGYRRHFVTLTTGFPDLQITIASILEAADRVAGRLVVVATHTGNFSGIPPTGLRVRVTGIAIVRITNGQLVEEHANSDGLGLLKQLGVIPESVKVPPLIF